jgi:hypothetical protein
MDFGTVLFFGVIAFVLWAVADNFIGGESGDKKEDRKTNFRVWLLAGAIGLLIWVLANVSNEIFPQ